MENFTVENPQSKLPKLIILKTIQKKLTLIGISRKLVTQSYPFDWKMLIAFLQIAGGISLIGMYIFISAESFIDITQSIFVGAGGSLVFFILLIFLLKVEKMFEFFDRFDIIVNTCT